VVWGCTFYFVYPRYIIFVPCLLVIHFLFLFLIACIYLLLIYSIIFVQGTDITPCYIDEDDMKHFHGTYKEVCDRHDPEFYAKFKKEADEYFLIKHRGERRGYVWASVFGIFVGGFFQWLGAATYYVPSLLSSLHAHTQCRLGGIFFDDLNDRDPEEIFEFCKDAANHVVAAYGPIIEKHKNDPFTEEQKQWQQLRRGRYVEFNLVSTVRRRMPSGRKINGFEKETLLTPSSNTPYMLSS